ncbi:ion channel protein [Escherichia coli]|uniref:ion channel protein n=1 Tax=Escherichia coli TaxID=562 RepID=UPI000CDDF4A5|nr:ion channel protein [Escherichia coli]POT08284.1 ion channel protein [Escherichia coli]
MLHPRARTMLLLSLPAVAIGIASSLILIVVMKIASVLQNLLWQRLPGTLGIAQDSPLWIIGVLTLTGIAVGLVIRFSQGHAGPDPACEPLIGAPVPPSALPGLIVALILGLAGGVSLGPEHPIMTVNIALAVAIGARLLPRVNRYGQMEMTDILSGAIVAAIAIAAGMVAVWCLPRLHAMMHQMKNPVLVLGIGGFILGILGVIGGPVSLFKGLDEMQQMVANQAFSTSDYFLLAVIKLAALVVAAASGFRGGRIFPAVFVGVALGLMLHEHVPAVPAAITVSCAILGIVLVVTRDGWLSLFMAAVVVPNTTLLPLLCIVMLPAWLLLAGKPMMMVNRPKQQPPHDNV